MASRDLWIAHCGIRYPHNGHHHQHHADAGYCPGYAIPVIPGPDPLLDDTELDTLIDQLLGGGDRHG